MIHPTPSTLLADAPDRRVVALPGGDVSYKEAGQGPAIVLLHGLLGNADSWVWQLRDLSDRFRVIAWDAPGYGLSDPAESDADIFAGILANLLDRLKVSEATVVGHSMGGVVAAALSKRPGNLMARLMLSCSHAGYAEPKDTPPSKKLTDRLKELAELGGDAYGRARAPGMVAPDASDAVLELAGRIAAQTRAEGLSAASRMLQFADMRSRYADLALPMLVLNGDRDTVVRAEFKKELIALTPDARHEVMRGVAHAPYLEDPETYNRLIRSFIGA